MTEDRTDEHRTVSGMRRSLLRAVGAIGAVGLAGCSGITDRTITASNTTVDEATLEEGGFERTARRTFTNSASREVGPLTGTLTAESKLTVYSTGESAPAPEESERWAASDAPLALWADNDPVRGLPAASVVEDANLTPERGDLPVDAVSAADATVLYPDDGSGGPVSLAETLVVAPADGVDWGDRESGGTVTLDEPVPVTDVGTFLPEGAVLPPDSA